MASTQKTVIVTGASQGIGAGIVQAFLARGYDVVGTARSATKSKELSASDHLALIDGDKTGGSIVSISAALVDNPIADVTASLSMITKGGLNAVTRSLAMEYAKEHIRFNAVAPGVVDSPLHAKDSEDSLKTLSPMGSISTVEDVASAVVYLTEARQISGEVLHVDGGAHVGKW
jgi:NAD(P)-dependent dehydrogenase (short-subunit alcohol dehydrogenase family)